MTVVSNLRADAFVLRPPKEFRLFLVHGPDEGLVRERVAAILLSIDAETPDAIGVKRLDGDEVAREPSLLLDEAYALSLFGGVRSICVDARSRDLTDALAPLLQRPPEKSLIVVRAGALSRGTSLRSSFERAGNAAAVECCPDSTERLIGLMDQEFQSSGFSISRVARDALMNILGDDRQVNRGEIAKLKLYAAGKSTIEFEDVLAVVGGDVSSGIDELIEQTLGGDRDAVSVTLRQFPWANTENDVIVARLTAQVVHSYRARQDMGNGRDGDFVSERASVNHQSSKFALERLNDLRSLHVKVRAEPAMARALSTRALWVLASRIRHRQPH